MKYIELSNRDLYDLYNNMMQRCYNEKVQSLKPGYQGVTVCDEGKNNRQAFYDGVNDGNFYRVKGEPTVELDHNILKKDNKIYCPEYCIFAPKTINVMISNVQNIRRPDGTVRGVKMVNGKYMPKIDGIYNLYDTEEEAFEVGAKYKKAHIVAATSKYYRKIPTKLYRALMEYEIDIND